MNRVLKETAPYGDNDQEEETVEDRINQIMEGRKMMINASYFAFTATPKNKTRSPKGSVKHYPFHSYTMRQAVQEGFILGVLKNYTPVESYYYLAKTVEDARFLTPEKPRKSCAVMLNHTRMPSARKSKSWWIISIPSFLNSSVITRHSRNGWATPFLVRPISNKNNQEP
ncbi:MAG: hypothetical protein M0Z56_13415 [Desulfobacteraceae bacterium]|nr:hypothetical protein [Desulfobacteraceae bacterium]